MKKTRWKNILRSIRSNLNRFLSIMMIVILGAGFMAGLAAASPDMFDSADRYVKEYRLFDIHIKSLTGFSEGAVSAIEAMEETDTVQSCIVQDMVLLQKGGTDFTSRVYGILDESGETSLNRIRLTQGRLPKAPGECVVESVLGRYSGETVSIGDHLTPSSVSTSYETPDDPLKEPQLTVVGICESPMCMSIEGDSTNIGSGTINLNVYVRRDLFSSKSDTDLFLTVPDAVELNTFSEEYDTLIYSVSDRLRPLAGQYPSEESGRIALELEEQTSQAGQLLQEAKRIVCIQEDLHNSMEQGLEMSGETARLLPEGSPLRAALLKTAEMKPIDSSSDAVSADQLTKDLESSLSTAKELEEMLAKGSWIFLTRNDLAGFSSYRSNVGKVSALAKIFPVFFFIVALLVALTTLTRLVEENRLQIGTLKALGCSNGQILLEYLLFSSAASVCGCLIGFSVGFWIFPAAINSAYSMMYILPPMATPVRWDIVSYVAPVTILSILLAAVWSCWNEFRSLPAKLMTPRAPAPGRRIWLEHISVLWRRFSFTQKVTFRNLFRYKKRFVMTMIGVAGCSALLLTGFGIKDSVNEVVDRQFGEIFQYDMIFVGSQDHFAEKDRQIQALLEDTSLIQEWMMASQENGRIQGKDSSHEITFLIPEDLQMFPEFVSLRSRTKNEQYTLSSNGIILTEKICEEMHIHAGDTIILEDGQGHTAEAKVDAVTEHYVASFAYMTEECYRSLFHTDPSYTSLLCISADGTDHTAEFLVSPYVLYGHSVESLKDSFSDSIRSINGVIYILIIASGLLCIVVLYNLTNVNICERRKELATLQVLGFFPNETQNYIFRETNFLSLLGAATGLLIGTGLHEYVVKTVEVNQVMFGREIAPLSYLIALGITMLFTLLVDLIMRRPINQIDMVESMKAND